MNIRLSHPLSLPPTREGRVVDGSDGRTKPGNTLIATNVTLDAYPKYTYTGGHIHTPSEGKICSQPLNRRERVGCHGFQRQIERGI